MPENDTPQNGDIRKNVLAITSLAAALLLLFSTATLLCFTGCQEDKGSQTSNDEEYSRRTAEVIANAESCRIQTRAAWDSLSEQIEQAIAIRERRIAWQEREVERLNAKLSEYHDTTKWKLERR